MKLRQFQGEREDNFQLTAARKDREYRPMGRKLKGYALGLLVGLGLLVSGQGLAAMVGFEGSGSFSVTPGSSFSLSLVGTDFDVAIQGGGIDLVFNPTVLRVDNITFNTAVWEFDTRVIDTDNAAGRVEGVLFSSFAGRSGSFPIATLFFTAVGAGNSALALTESPLNPFASDGLNVPVGFQNASVSVAPVPLPAGVWLLMSGLGLLMTRLRRRCKAPQGLSKHLTGVRA